MKKILKNNTNENIFVQDLGINFISGESYTVPEQEYLLLSSSENIIPLLTNGSISVFFNNIELPITDAIHCVKYPDYARAVIFDNSTNGFNSTNVQSAIEEVKSLINISNGELPKLREVTLQIVDGMVIGMESNLLFETTQSGTILFLKEL